MTIKLSNKDYIWSYIGVFFSVGSSILLLPFILYFLSDEMYGLWGVFQSISAITILFDFGFSTTFARNINYCWSGAAELKKTGAKFVQNNQPNFYLMTRVMKVCQYVFLVISLTAFVCMATFGTFYINYICRDIAGNKPLISWMFYAVAIFFNLYYGYYNSFLLGVGAISALNKVTVISRLVQIMLTITLLAMGLDIVATGVSYLSYGFIFRTLSRREFLKFNNIGNNLKMVQGKVTRSDIQELFGIVWYNASREGGITLASYLANQACTIICPIFLPLSITGVYSLAVQLSNTLSNVSAALYNANQPVIQSAYISKNQTKMRSTMSLIVVSYVAIYTLGLIAILLFGLPLIRLIRPETTPSISIMLGVGIYYFILKFRDCYTSYFSCTNRIPYTKAFVLSSITCVVVAILFLKYTNWGLWGLLIAEISSQMIYNVWHWPVIVHRELKLRIPQMMKLGVGEIRYILESFHFNDGM